MKNFMKLKENKKMNKNEEERPEPIETEEEWVTVQGKYKFKMGEEWSNAVMAVIKEE